ncbi:hypothetical protein C1280_35345 [Gemmata obscuriglobus]|uniref:Uncharacterized protein n=1 Tax=Gemmata obscuriglobus TaxID=114 RepID=A0A2Z3HL27_9BACT|nr:hypothetical protein C1280_35345 [Gemmata obscuriglobus]
MREWTAEPLRGAKPNRTAGTIDGVLICGTSSANGRDYPVAVLKRDCAKYEGRPVNCDHSRESTVERRLGWFTNVRPGPDGRPRGTLNLLKSHPMYERVMEAAERNPALFGFSHVALCDTRPGTGGREMVEAIRSVESIDLVAQPATTKGLFEGTAVKTTLRAVIDRLRGRLVESRQRAARKLLLVAEDDAAMGGLMDSPVDEPAGDADPSEGITAAFNQACMGLVQQGLDDPAKAKEVLGKLKEMFAAHAKVNTDGTPNKDGDPETGGGDDGDDTTPESRRPASNAISEALDVCDSIGYRPDRADLDTIAAAPKERRKAVAERLKKASGAPADVPERPSSAGRGRITTEAITPPKKATEGAPPSDPKEFAAWIA